MHARIKYVEIDFYFIYDLVMQEKLDVRFAPSNKQVAYVSNKPLGETSFNASKTKPMVLLCV